MNKVTFEPTPNPATMKFHLQQQITAEAFDCPTAQDCEKSPLAAKIFGFPWTNSVFVGNDFITVTKQDWVEWQNLAEPLAGLIQEHVESGEPIVLKIDKSSSKSDENETPAVKKIKELLEMQVRPAVAMDGGDITFSHYQDGIVYLHLKGSCSGCPSSTATLKDGIEVLMKEHLPEIQAVVAI